MDTISLYDMLTNRQLHLVQGISLSYLHHYHVKLKTMRMNRPPTYKELIFLLLGKFYFNDILKLRVRVHFSFGYFMLDFIATL